MRKKITAILILILCTLGMCGCATVGYSNIILDDGSIRQQIVVAMDEDTITSSGLLMESVKNDIETYAKTCYQNLLSDFKSAVIDEDETRDNEIKSFVAANTKLQITKKENTVVVTLNFNSIDTYYYFYKHHLPETAETSGDITDYTFYEKENHQSVTEFHDIANNDIAVYWLSYFSTYIPNVDFSDCSYYYIYSTPYQKIYSDADYVFEDEYGNYSHLWQFTSDDLTGENAQTGDVINLYTVAVKSPLWYFVALGATAILMVVLYIICAVKDNKKKKA